MAIDTCPLSFCRSNISPFLFSVICLLGDEISEKVTISRKFKERVVQPILKVSIRLPVSCIIIWLAPREGKMNRILCSDWLSTRAGKMGPRGWAYLARSGLPALFPAKAKFFGIIFWPYNKSFIVQACSVKMAGYWPRSFLAFLWASTSFRSIKTQRRTWPISSHLGLTFDKERIYICNYVHVASIPSLRIILKSDAVGILE